MTIFKRREPKPKLDHSALKLDKIIQKQFSNCLAKELGPVEPTATTEQLEHNLKKAITSVMKLRDTANEAQ